MAEYYLRMEGVNLAHFIYDTNDLSTIRGGSFALRNCVKEVGRHVKDRTGVNLHEISTGASTGWFHFEAQQPQDAVNVLAAARAHLDQDPTLRHATVMVDVAPQPDDFVLGREGMLARNRWAQMRSPSVRFPGSDPDGKICKTDHIRPGEPSASVQARRTFGKEQKHHFYEQETDRTGLTFTNEFGALSACKAAGNLHHKMAVIYADGNGFGDIQRKLQSVDEVAEFDRKVRGMRKVALTALLDTIRERPSWKTSTGELRLETLLWGGDEFILVVPAWEGWWALDFLFRELSKEADLTHTGAVVFCHHKAPIHCITQLAKGLADAAKGVTRDGNHFTYQTLESFDDIGRDIQEGLRARYSQASNIEHWVMKPDLMKKAAQAKGRLEEETGRRVLHERALRAAQNGENAEGDAPACFGNSQARWVHLAELWDYLRPESYSEEA